jgi:hypothetical protein
MARPDELGDMPMGNWERLQELGERFQKTWMQAQAAGTNVDLTPFVPPRGDPIRWATLHELIKIRFQGFDARARAAVVAAPREVDPINPRDADCFRPQRQVQCHG